MHNFTTMVMRITQIFDVCECELLNNKQGSMPKTAVNLHSFTVLKTQNVT